MIESIKRISTTLFILGLMVVGITTLFQLAVSCPVDSNCLGAALSLGSSEVIEISSMKISSIPRAEGGAFSELALLHKVAQMVGIYLLLIAAIVLIALEVRELHYLKLLSAKRRKI